MSLIGEKIRVLTSSDRTLTGRTGLVMLETANTLVIGSAGREIRVPKAGAAFMLIDSGKVLTGGDVAGRLQDRLGRKQV